MFVLLENVYRTKQESGSLVRFLLLFCMSHTAGNQRGKPLLADRCPPPPTPKLERAGAGGYINMQIANSTELVIGTFLFIANLFPQS